MNSKIGEMLSDIRSQLPTLFQNVIDNCKKIVESYETHLKTLEETANTAISGYLDKSFIPEDTYKRFKEDQEKALMNFREENQKKLRHVSEKALVKIREMNKKSQEIVNSVVEFEQDLKQKVNFYIDEYVQEPKKMIAGFNDEVETFYMRYSKLKKDVDKITKTLPKKMDEVYEELGNDVKNLEAQTDKAYEVIVEKYRRLTS